MSEGVTEPFRFPHFKLGSCHDVFRLDESWYSEWKCRECSILSWLYVFASRGCCIPNRYIYTDTRSLVPSPRLHLLESSVDTEYPSVDWSTQNQNKYHSFYGAISHIVTAVYSCSIHVVFPLNRWPETWEPLQTFIQPWHPGGGVKWSSGRDDQNTQPKSEEWRVKI